MTKPECLINMHYVSRRNTQQDLRVDGKRNLISTEQCRKKQRHIAQHEVSIVMSSACIFNYPEQDYKPSKALHTHIVGTLGFIYPNTHPSLSCFCVCPGTGGCDLLLQEIAGDEWEWIPFSTPPPPVFLFPFLHCRRSVILTEDPHPHTRLTQSHPLLPVTQVLRDR
jgi:hypothetical protein